MKRIILIILVLLSTSLWCQQYQRSAEIVAPFLQISPDARGMAMGNTGVAAKPNVFSMYYNPARYSFIEDKTTIGAGLRHCTMSYNLYDLSVAQKIGKISTLAVSFRYCLYKEINYRGDQNEDLGSYKPKEYAIDLSYSIKLGEHFSAAVAGHYIHSALFDPNLIRYSKIAHDFAFDGGAYYTHEMNLGEFAGNYSFGLSLTNLGGKTGYRRYSDYYSIYESAAYHEDFKDIDFLPTTVSIGGGADLSKGKNSFALNFDLSKIIVPKFSTYNMNLGVGLEYGRDVKDYTFFVRAGYYNMPSIFGNINNYTMGVGAKILDFDIDFACNISTNTGSFYDYLMTTIKFGF